MGMWNFCCGGRAYRAFQVRLYGTSEVKFGTGWLGGGQSKTPAGSLRYAGWFAFAA
jgi:hypothetical protein